MIWGSFSGVSGSVSINDQGDNFIKLTGSGKQNLTGNQLIAFILVMKLRIKLNLLSKK